MTRPRSRLFAQQVFEHELTARGVVFEICEITLKNRNLKRDQFVLDATFTPSGVVRVADLQTQQGFAYIKP